MAVPDMRGKICLVTGANGAIGQAVAVALARLGAMLVLACRSRERGEAAKAAVIAASGGAPVDLLLVDLSSQASIRQAAAEFLAAHDRLDVLINNAGVYKSSRTLTTDGLETMFATNHLAPFLMTNLLLGALKASGSARIITTSAPSTTALDFDDLQGERGFSALRAFGASKMCNLLFTYALTRRLDGTGVTANAVNPGLVKSDLMKETSLIVRLLLRYVIGSTPQRAAETFAYLASSPAAGVSGKFFQGRTAIDSNAYSHDAAVQEHLWQVSADLTRLAQ